jgi:hypothetical protein
VNVLSAYAAAHSLEFEAVPLVYHACRSVVPPNRMFDSSVAVVYVSPVQDDPRAFLLSVACPDLVLAAPAKLASGLFFGRRLKAVNQCRRERATGLLAVSAGQPGVAHELRRLASEARAAGRVPYTLCVGKAGPIKLMNLPGLSVFVLVGCPLSTLLLSETLASPVCVLLTPLEHALACGPERAWRPLFLFGDATTLQEEDEEDSYEKEERAAVPSTGALVLTSGDAARQIALVSPAAAMLRQPGRWLGVDPSAPDAAPTAPIQGRTGIASQYEEEPNKL